MDLKFNCALEKNLLKHAFLQTQRTDGLTNAKIEMTNLRAGNN